MIERPKDLTDASVRTYKPEPKRRIIADPRTASLYLVIGAKPKGSKAWMMRFRRPDGRPAKLVIGRFDASGFEPKTVPVIGQPLSLLAARALAADLHRQRANGTDVIADHKAKKRSQFTAAADHAGSVFAGAVREYIDEKARLGDTRTWRDTARWLGLQYLRDGSPPVVIPGGLVALWGDKPVREINSVLVHNIINDTRKIGMPGIKARNKGISDNRSRLLFGALSSLFSWLQRERRIDINPCAGVPSPVPAKSRDRVLSNEEIGIFWRACDELGAPFGSIYKICLLTGCRLNEAVRMTRSELSEDGSTWSLSAARTKNKRQHVVPLSPLAQSIIADVPRIEGPYVFTFDGKKPASGGNSRLKARLDKIMEQIAGHQIEPFRTHDTRRTFVTGCIELGIAPHIIEVAINHVSGHRSGVAGVYNKSQLLPERRAALERWANHVEGLVLEKAANVTPIGKGRRRGRQ